jgi:hypothetical protein
MVDIEPILEYKYSNFGIKNICSIFVLLYLAFIYPLFSILNYDIKTEKEVIRDIVKHCVKLTNCSIYKVSKKDLIIDKNIMYMTNHASVGDFFIDPYITHYAIKFIALNKVRKLLPIMGILCYLTSSAIFISSGNTKESVIENFKKIEEMRTSDNIRNISLYPEGLRRAHRPVISAVLKKGFIYHSFEKKLPIQIIHTTNKDYVLDDANLVIHKDTKLFTYYGPKIDPQKLKEKFEKKHKREYTKEDYYTYIYKQWGKIWSKMDKYRIDTLRNQGISHDECIKKMDHYSTKFPLLEDKIINGDKPLSMPFLLLRSTLWSIIYFIIFKVIEKCFASVSYIYKQQNTSKNANCFKFSFLSNLPFSLASLTSHASTAQ